LPERHSSDGHESTFVNSQRKPRLVDCYRVQHPRK
jgi:hypothetical protein